VVRMLKIMDTEVAVFTAGFQIEGGFKRRIAVFECSDNDGDDFIYWDGVEFANFILSNSSREFAKRVYDNLKREFG